ncbi:MAG: hypothetical protein HYR55_02405 [Acidobacteria bacterium]|nr:hypothetical protein [Acidobacteriota bacterium]
MQAVDPTNPDTVYGDVGGQRRLMRSTDAGETWATIFPDGLGPMAIDPGNPDILYMAIRTGLSTSDVYKTTDAGLTWSSTSTANLDFFAIDPQDGRYIYAGTFLAGIYRSTDGGRNWNPSGLSRQWVFSVTIDEENPNIVYAMADGIYKSEDRGWNWVRISTYAPRKLVIDPRARHNVCRQRQSGSLQKRRWRTHVGTAQPGITGNANQRLIHRPRHRPTLPSDRGSQRLVQRRPSRNLAMRPAPAGEHLSDRAGRCGRPAKDSSLALPSRFLRSRSCPFVGTPRRMKVVRVKK